MMRDSRCRLISLNARAVGHLEKVTLWRLPMTRFRVDRLPYWGCECFLRIYSTFRFFLSLKHDLILSLIVSLSLSLRRLT